MNYLKNEILCTKKMQIREFSRKCQFFETTSLHKMTEKWIPENKKDKNNKMHFLTLTRRKQTTKQTWRPI